MLCPGSQTLKPDAPAGSEIQNNIKSDHTQSGSNGGVGGPNTQDVRGVLVSRLAPEDVAALSETDNVPLGVHSPEKRQNFTRCGLLGPGGTIPTGSKRCPVGQCCSHRGYCGVRTAHCGYGCNPEFGLCGPPEFRRLATELGDHNSPSPSHKLFRESAESRKVIHDVVGEIFAVRVAALLILFRDPRSRCCCCRLALMDLPFISSFSPLY